jgi:hypothetical protein
MKKIILDNLYVFLCCVCLTCVSFFSHAQGDSSSVAKRQSLIYLQYHVKNNRLPFLFVQTKNKIQNAFNPAPDVHVTIYLDSDLAKDAVVGEIVTNEKGIASIGIPSSLAAKWNQQHQHTFFAHSDSSRDFDISEKSISVVIAKLELDTVASESGRSLVARLVKNENGSWVPVPGVDVRISVKRSGGYLSVGEESYATDSTGKATAEFKLEKLPGDANGSLEAVALIDDNDEVGTLETSLAVPWGTPTIYKSQFGDRSLWATGTRAPVWLMLMAYGCIIAVWSVIIYLITRVRLIAILGRRKSTP